MVAKILIGIGLLVVIPLVVELLSDEISGRSKRVSVRLVRRATAKLPAAYRNRYEEEWIAELDAAPGPLSTLVQAISLACGARRMGSTLRSISSEEIAAQNESDLATGVIDAGVVVLNASSVVRARRGLSRSDTAILVLMYSMLGTMCLLLVTVGNWQLLTTSLNPNLRIAAATGGALVALHMIGLMYLLKIQLAPKVRMLLGELVSDVALGGSYGDRHIDAHHKVYRLTIGLGLLGLWLLVSLSGGPFLSPVAPLLLGAFFIGMLRAETKTVLNIAVIAGFIAVATSLGFVIVSRTTMGADSAMRFSSVWYLPAVLVTGLLIYMFCSATLFSNGVAPRDGGHGLQVGD